MNNKILKDLIKKLISESKDLIKDIKKDKDKDSDENLKMIKDLEDMISMYNGLINKLSLINSEFIDEVDVLDLVFKNSDFNYHIKKDILRSIMNYNSELYLKIF